jgi:hypothetical protein
MFTLEIIEKKLREKGLNVENNYSLFHQCRRLGYILSQKSEYNNKNEIIFQILRIPTKEGTIKRKERIFSSMDTKFSKIY